MAWTRNCLSAWVSGGALATLVVFIVGPAVLPFVVPMSRYYDLRAINVFDTTEGVSPFIIVDRTIARDFRGRYEVDILRVEGSEFTAWWACGSHVSDWRWYREEAELPQDLTLDWWMGIPPNLPCHLSVGTYKIVTTIYAQGLFGVELSATLDSNLFKVAPVAP
jgi:hypothetical protein